MAATAEGVTDGALTSNTYRGLYTSTDAGQTWTYDALFSGASEATSATSVVYNAAAGLFFAAVRYHGFYSSPDGLTWTRLATQPGTGLLSTTACPQNYITTCPIYRGEITVVPGRNEMYVWFVSFNLAATRAIKAFGRALNGGASWTAISDTGIISCGDIRWLRRAAGILQSGIAGRAKRGFGHGSLCRGDQSLQVLDQFRQPHVQRSIAFMNLTHVYGCDPLAALAHVHPDQHALAYTIPGAGTDVRHRPDVFRQRWRHLSRSRRIRRLTTGSCSGTNLVRRPQSEPGIDDAVRELLAASHESKHASGRNAG
jgi:hypothetical protein